MSWDQPVGVWSFDWSWLWVGDYFNRPTLHLVDKHVEHLDLAGGGVNRDLCQPSALQGVDWEDEDLAALAVLVRGDTSILLQVGGGLWLVLVVSQPS